MRVNLQLYFHFTSWTSLQHCNRLFAGYMQAEWWSMGSGSAMSHAPSRSMQHLCYNRGLFRYQVGFLEALCTTAGTVSVGSPLRGYGHALGSVKLI